MRRPLLRCLERWRKDVVEEEEEVVAVVVMVVVEDVHSWHRSGTGRTRTIIAVLPS